MLSAVTWFCILSFENLIYTRARIYIYNTYRYTYSEIPIGLQVQNSSISCNREKEIPHTLCNSSFLLYLYEMQSERNA